MSAYGNLWQVLLHVHLASGEIFWAGQCFSILAIQQYGNETISTSSRFQGNNNTNINITMSGNFSGPEDYYWRQEPNNCKTLQKIKIP